MIEKIGNIWDFPADYTCVFTNGVVRGNKLVMGGGQAKEALNLFKGIDVKLGSLVNEYGNVPFILFKEKLISFPTKNDYKDKSDIDLIKKSTKQLVFMVNNLKAKVVSMGRPGCGLGGLSWEEVKDFLSKELDDRFFVFHNE